MFRLEEAKIYLSDKIGSKSALGSSYEKYNLKIFLPKGTLHPDIDIEENLNGNDLKVVIQNMWRFHYGKILTKTVTEAEEKLKRSIERIDKVIIAGGSSKLPFMAEEVLTVLPTLVKKEDIYIGQDLGNAVACGIACECKELVKSKKYPDLTVGTVAPCLLKDLYIGLKSDRRGKITIPKIDGIDCNGLLFSSPFEITKVTKSYELEVEMDFSDRLFYYFDDKPIIDDDPTYLNVSDFVISVPAGGKISRKFQLDIDICENGSVRPIFSFRGKGAEAKKIVKPICCKEFYLEGKNIIEGDGFIGIDFGTSNSYVAKFLSPKKTEVEVNDYPAFEISHSILERLRAKQVEIEGLQSSNVLAETIVHQQARKNKYLMIFHSNKIEGNVLTKGETEQIINGVKPTKLSKSQVEALNLDKAFSWVIDNLDLISTNPENFIRNINKLILDNIIDAAGEYRTGPVKIAGMEYVPPAGFIVPNYMEQLSEEIKKGVGDRSPLEFTASIHTKLVMIHPFEDGNGRTARLVMNAILLKSNLPMLIINYADKQRYFDAIVSANNGDISDFIQFICDCLEAEIEEIKSTLYVDSPLQEATDAVIETANKTNNIFGAKLSALLEKKLEEQLKEKEAEYLSWCSIYDGIKLEVSELVNKFNISDFRQLGYSMKLYEYDHLTFEKYIELAKGKNVPRTWFFRVDFLHGRSYEKILFFFQHASQQLKKRVPSSPVSLCLARFDGTSYRRLVFEPVQLHEIGISDDRPLFLLQEDRLETGDVKPMISDYLFYDVANNYL